VKPITIIGGGLAGLTAGIALRQQGVPVTILEAGHYPRHRVCGEFISGRGQRSLERLGLLEKIQRRGGRWAETAGLFAGSEASQVRKLPRPALCISRFQLDHFLAEEFAAAGGSLRCDQRWHGRGSHEGMVRATGKQVEVDTEGWRWIGLKVHARAVELAADLELHFLTHGYVGLCRLNGDEVNVCGLFRSRTPWPLLARDWKRFLKGDGDSILAQRLGHVEFDDESFCSVAGLAFHTIEPSAEAGAEAHPCIIGDALAVIPPLTGNGMSIAFESAAVAAGTLAEYSRGALPWCETQERVAEECSRLFRWRFIWALATQRLLFGSGSRDFLFYVVQRWPLVFRMLFRLTR
jgi:flavin-dependent dehydrogenase